MSRTPKRGDRCEYSEWSSKTMKRERICNVRHLEGRPPGQIVACKQGREHVLFCAAHAMKASSYTGPIRGKAVKKQKPGPLDAIQEDLTKACEDSIALQHKYLKFAAAEDEYYVPPMPE